MDRQRVSNEQDRLSEGQLRLRGGSYVALIGATLELWNDASCGTRAAVPMREQDQLSFGKVLVYDGHGEKAYYSVWDPSMHGSGEAGILNVID